MLDDIAAQNPLEKNSHKLIKFHEDYSQYKEWRDLKAACSEYIVEHLSSCSAFMKELGVDPVIFAEQFVDKHQSLKEQKQEAASLAEEWKLPKLDHHQRMHVCDLRGQTKRALVQEWYASIKEAPHKSHLIMTYSKADTAVLNEEARALMKQDGIVSREEYLHTIHKKDKNDFGDVILTKETKAFAAGDRILFTENDNGLGVKNGTLGTILEVDRSKIKAKLDGVDKVVSFASKLYPFFDQGWAANIHRTQGVTVDRSFMLASHETYRNLAYVGMTRHREWVKVFGSKLDFWRDEIFLKRLSSSHEKLSAHDYKNTSITNDIPKRDSKLQQILSKLGNELEAIKFITRESWNTIAERFLGKTPKAKEIRIPQNSLSEEIRARELFEKVQNLERSQSSIGGRQVSPFSYNAYKKATPTVHFYRKEDVLRSLSRSEIESIFQAHIHTWVEKPKMSKLGNQLRFGSKGGFVVNRDSGQWYSHYHGEGGDIFSFLSRTQKIPYAQAIRELGERCKAIPSSYQAIASQEEKLKAWEEVKQAEEIAKLKAAHLKIQKLYEKSHPIQGTVAERYLREHRQIKETTLPKDLRFIASYKNPHTNKHYPALVAFAHDPYGKRIAAQVTCLDPITGNKASVAVKKRSLGVIKGAMVEIQKGEGITYVAEGIETALSLKEAGMKGRILATLGLSNIANIYTHLKGEPVILCGDADSPQSAAYKTFFKAVHTLKERDISVTFIKAQGENGRDFNDVLKEEGIEAVKAAFKDIKAYKSTQARSLKEQTVLNRSSIPAGDNKTQENETLPQSLVTQDLEEKYNKSITSEMKQRMEESYHQWKENQKHTLEQPHQ